MNPMIQILILLFVTSSRTEVNYSTNYALSEIMANNDGIMVDIRDMMVDRYIVSFNDTLGEYGELEKNGLIVVHERNDLSIAGGTPMILDYALDYVLGIHGMNGAPFYSIIDYIFDIILYRGKLGATYILEVRQYEPQLLLTIVSIRLHEQSKIMYQNPEPIDDKIKAKVVIIRGMYRN